MARAALNRDAQRRVLSALGDLRQSERVTVEILRALGDHVADFQPAAGQALVRLQTPTASFRTRFLLLEPSAALAAHDPELKTAFGRALASEREPRFRAQALSVLPDPQAFWPEIGRALSDPDVRVREAAVHAATGLPAAEPVLVQRLLQDEWPLVRIAAADALANAKPSVGADGALASALSDESPHVRAHVVIALGEHHAVVLLPRIRVRFADIEEYPIVRAAAAQALGTLCDQVSADALTQHALVLADPMADANQHVVGAAALLALADLRPLDLQKRLQPLLAKGAPPQAKQAAEAVLQRAQGACGSRRMPRKSRETRLVPAS